MTEIVFNTLNFSALGCQLNTLSTGFLHVAALIVLG